MRLRTAIAVVAALAIVVGGIVGVNMSPRRPLLNSVKVVAGGPNAASIQGTWPAPKPKVKPKPKHATAFNVADAIVPNVALYSAPNVPMPAGSVTVPMRPGNVVTNPTWEGLPVVFLVKGRKGGWLDVQVSARPNGIRAWIKASDVKLRTVPNWVRIELRARKATVFHGDTPIFSTTVAVGRDSAPTPTGVYFVDGIVFLDDTSGPYGIAQMSVSAFSDIYQTFGGGVGQIAMHGTNAPGLLGQAVSHGCVRFANDALQQMIMRAPTGTPVEILP